MAGEAARSQTGAHQSPPHTLALALGTHTTLHPASPLLFFFAGLARPGNASSLSLPLPPPGECAFAITDVDAANEGMASNFGAKVLMLGIPVDETSCGAGFASGTAVEVVVFLGVEGLVAFSSAAFAVVEASLLASGTHSRAQACSRG